MPMKTTFLSLSLFLLFQCSSQAQNTPPPAPVSDNPTTGFIALGFGSAMPLGDYGSTSNSTASGYAQSGSIIDISAGIPINHSNFVIALKFDNFSNGYDIQSYSNNFVANSPGYDVEVINSGGYHGETALIGLYGTIPIHNFVFDYRFMGGFMFASYPAINYTVTDNNVDTVTNFNQSSSNSTAFAFDIGIGLRWNVSHHFCLRLDYDYLSANPSFTPTLTQINTNYGNTVSVPYTYRQKFTLENATFGIGYVFGRK